MTYPIPARLTAGDAWSWELPGLLADYPPADYAIEITIAPETGGTPEAIEGTPAADAWAFAVPSSKSCGFTPGVHRWALLATETATGDRCTLARGRLTVDPDPEAAAGDARSRAERILAAIDAAIEGRATKDADAFTIEGRSITRTPIADLQRLRNSYRAEVAAERGRSAPFRIRRVTH